MTWFFIGFWISMVRRGLMKEMCSFLVQDRGRGLFAVRFRGGVSFFVPVGYLFCNILRIYW